MDHWINHLLTGIVTRWKGDISYLKGCFDKYSKEVTLREAVTWIFCSHKAVS